MHADLQISCIDFQWLQEINNSQSPAFWLLCLFRPQGEKMWGVLILSGWGFFFYTIFNFFLTMSPNQSLKSRDGIILYLDMEASTSFTVEKQNYTFSLRLVKVSAWHSGNICPYTSPFLLLPIEVRVSLSPGNTSAVDFGMWVCTHASSIQTLSLRKLITKAVDIVLFSCGSHIPNLDECK